MVNRTNRRKFLKEFTQGVTGLSIISFLSGCIAPHISPSAGNQDNGDPWRCGNCGHLTRSNIDISSERCPRCFSKRLARVTEEEFSKYLEFKST